MSRSRRCRSRRREQEQQELLSPGSRRIALCPLSKLTGLCKTTQHRNQMLATLLQQLCFVATKFIAFSVINQLL
jgi:hypothetical protein